jgi:hypothetical protein
MLVARRCFLLNSFEAISSATFLFWGAQPGHRAHSPRALKCHNRLEICTIVPCSSSIRKYLPCVGSELKRWLVGWRAQYVMAVKSLRYPLNEETQLAKRREDKTMAGYPESMDRFHLPAIRQFMASIPGALMATCI